MRKSISEKAADKWGVPKDVIMNIPRLTVSGDKEIYIENHKGLLGYSTNEIRISTPMGIIKICGENLNIDRIRLEDVLITGVFKCVEYEI